MKVDKIKVSDSINVAGMKHRSNCIICSAQQRNHLVSMIPSSLSGCHFLSQGILYLLIMRSSSQPILNAYRDELFAINFIIFVFFRFRVYFFAVKHLFM
jgi:hypothetical protein